MTTDAAATRTWDTISQRLREALNPSTYDTWFGGTEALEASPERLVVGVPNEFTKTWIEGHFGSLLNAAAAEHELVVELRVAVSDAVRAASEPEPEPDLPQMQAPAPAQVGVVNPRYTFDLFVIGPSNRFAHAAALAVAEAPAGGVQPALHLRIDRAGENPPAPGRRTVRDAAAPVPDGPLRDDGNGPQRVCRRFAGQKHGRIQRPL
jgi:hypothetical protein